MRVTVRLMGPYRRAAGGVAELTLEVEEPTLAGVIRSLAIRFPEAGRKLLSSPDRIEPAVRVVLNDVVLQGVRLDHNVRDGDRIAFVPIVGGGGAPTLH